MRRVAIAGCLVVMLMLAVLVVYAQGGSLRCPDRGAVGSGTPYPPDRLSLSLSYLQRCGDCFPYLTPTPGEYSIAVPSISVPTDVPVALSLSGDVLSGLSEQTSAIVGADEAGPFWKLSGYYIDSPPIYQFWDKAGTEQLLGQSLTLGPFPEGAVYGVVFDVAVEDGKLGGWGVGGVNVPADWLTVPNTLFPLDRDYAYGGYMPLLDSEFVSGDVRVCVGVGDACSVASGVEVSDALPAPVAGEFTLGLYVTHGYWYVRNVRLIGEFPLAPPSTPVPTVTPYAQFYLGEPLRLRKFTSETHEHFCARVDDTPGVLVGSWMSHTSTGGLNVKRMGSGGSCTSAPQVWGNTSDNHHVGSPDKCNVDTYAGVIEADICAQTEAAYMAAMAAVWSGYVSNGVSYTKKSPMGSSMPAPAGSSRLFTVQSVFNHSPGYLFVVPIYYGLPPVVVPTATPTAVPTAVPGSLDCRDIVWRDYSDNLADFGFESDEWIRQGDCFEIIPEFSISLPAIGLIGFDGLEIGWDGLQTCVDWVQFPVIKILGVQFSVSLVLVVVVGFIIVRLLTW